MGASRQCQQHIPLNQKQPPHYSSYGKEGGGRRSAQGAALGWYGPCRSEGMGLSWTGHRRGSVWVAKRGEGDDLTAGIAYVDR